MHSIRMRLSLLFVTCTLASIFLVSIFVNVTLNNKFNEYVKNSQEKRYDRIVSAFQELYHREGKWTVDTGLEFMHEAYMGNYCLTLKDQNKHVVWGMKPEDIKNRDHLSSMLTKDQGIYSTRNLEIIVAGQVVGYVEVGHYSPVLLSEEDIQFKTSINTSIFMSGAITLLLVIGASLYASRQFSRPIKEVADISVQLSKGNLEIKSMTKSKLNELEYLRRSINILAEKLKNQDTLRKRLITDLSHEIRTPLHVLQNNVEAMIDGIFPVTEERLVSIHTEVIRFTKLVNNLNALKEFDDEYANLHFHPIQLGPFLSSICKDFHVTAESKNIKIEYFIHPSEEYVIQGDSDQLKQVFYNLLSNAVKYNHENGRIQIHLFSDEKRIIVEIRDTGIGIKQEDLPFVFERLYRGDRSRNLINGTGIGLTIAKKILLLHGAQIDIESSEDMGTTVLIYFQKS